MTATPRDAPHAGAPFAVMLRGALLPSAAAGLLAVVVFGLLRGGDAALSAGIGVVVAVVFFASGLAVMSRLVRDANPMLFMAVALSVYLGQMIVLLVFVVAMDAVQWLDRPALGITILVVALTWQVAQMVAWRRARTMVYDQPAQEAP